MASKASAPLNIIKNSQADNICNLKCAYNFQYAPTNLQIANKGSYLRWKVDNVTQPPVIYNDQNYVVSEARLYQPSLHTYGAKAAHADAELIIVHTNSQSAQSMLVCIPIRVSTITTSDAANLFDLILAEVTRTAPNDGNQTIYNNPTFNLGKFIPMKPYYSYTGTLAWAPQNGSYDYIVFDIADAIQMTATAFQILSGGSKNGVSIINGVIQAHSIKALPESANPDGLFYNPNGPTTATGNQNGEIYIDCRPTGDTGEVLVAARKDAGGLLNMSVIKNVWNFALLKVVLAAIIMLVIWRLAMKFIRGIAVNTAKLRGGARITRM